MTNEVEVFIEREAFYALQDEKARQDPSYRTKTYSQFCETGKHILKFVV